ncbi:hypothetical protein [Spirosoma radiotolerans]|uniref:Uncharacterized protein n=1 Tax=Spirosoma radiotolerans TaxID=1379870 RepID=A0A0E3ZZF7_9BACT|nr:hypothetical protein [Spirosoma radiotolerans]AKD58004.1 hypothetical protein SD10_26955 [Spirosoma radiotolerans]
MGYYGVFLFVCLAISNGSIGSTNPDPKVYFPNLTEKMGLKTPRLKEGEYEIRVWEKCQLCYGEAHVLYRLVKKGEKVSLSRYTIHFNKNEFIRAKQTSSTTRSLQELWNHLVEKDILTSSYQSTVEEELHPKPQKDSTWNVIDADGSISVHAKRKKPSFWIGDGESYHFDIFSADSYRMYEYHNPKEYLRQRPDIVGLQKVVSILDELSSAFY